MLVGRVVVGVRLFWYLRMCRCGGWVLMYRCSVVGEGLIVLCRG